jgi:hypothetical protein
MSLPVPVVGNESGPQFAIDINTCMAILDQHNHTSGSGVLITPSALNINANLPINNHFLTGLAGLTLQAQGSTPANNTVYESGNDLFFVDGVGNNVRITQSGAVAGTPGSISNLVPPASASYVSSSGTFVFQQNVSIAANIDGASFLFRNSTPNSTFAITVQAPAGLSSNYSITWPSLPVASKIMTIDNTGQIFAVTDADNTTIQITSNLISIKPLGITNALVSNSAAIAYSKLNLSNSIVNADVNAAANIDGSKLADTSVQISKLGTTNVVNSPDSLTFSTASTSYTNVTNLSNTITTHGRMVKIFFTFPATTLGGAVGVQTDGGAFLRILRDGATTVVDFQLPTGIDGYLPPGIFYDIPSAGSHSYTVQTKISVGTFVSWTSVVLVTVED